MADIRTTGVLDDFIRADEVPILFPWANSDAGAAYAGVLNSNAFTHPSRANVGSPPAPTPNNGWSSWTTQTFDVPATGWLEVWGRAQGGNASGIAWGLSMFKQISGTNQVDGYLFRQGVSTGGGQIDAYRVTNGVRTSILSGAATSGFTAGSNNTYALFRLNASGNLQWWSSTDGGANWTLRESVTDTTYTGTFYLGMTITDNSASQILSWDYFGGGVEQPNRPQFFRLVRN